MTTENGTSGNRLTGDGVTENRSAENGATGGNPLIRLANPGGANGLEFGVPAGQRHFEMGVARLEAEMETARSRGVLGLMRLRYDAWLEERMKGPAIAKMQARQAVLTEQCKTAEAEIRLRATVQSGEVGAQRHKIEWNEVNRQRLAGELQSLGITLGPTAYPASATSVSPVSAHVTDEQVEALALRGFMQGVETEEDWPPFKEELSKHLSPYAVEEVGGRLRELWRLSGQAQGIGV
jgi:hypothetical protein